MVGCSRSAHVIGCVGRNLIAAKDAHVLSQLRGNLPTPRQERECKLGMHGYQQ